MATEVQINNRAQGGGRPLRIHRALLAIVSGVVGVVGTGAITGGTGGAAGVYPLAPVGGVLATGGSPVQGTFTVAGGAVTAISITSPGQYTTAPTGFSFAAAGVTGAAATPTTAQVATMAYPAANDTGSIAPGSYISTFKAFTNTAFAGSPTNVYVSIGASFQGQDYVAQTDAKTQGELTLSKVGSGLAAVRNVVAPLYVTVLVNGGANAVSGQLEVEIHYAPSNV